MADIELVIKIDADVYARLFDNGIPDNEIAEDDICEMVRALRLGKSEDTSLRLGRPLSNDLSKVTKPVFAMCKDCKYFEYDSVAKVAGVSLIVAHEICERWGNGCKTRENGYCFLFEPQERSDKG